MTKINPQKIVGKWQSGIALDVHTLSSTYLGVNEQGHEVYDTKRSELGELLYRLKYKSDTAAANDIVTTAAEYLKPHLSKFDVIVPVPPSGIRPVQPVITLAKGIGKALGVPVVECVGLTRSATQLKGVIDPEKTQGASRRVTFRRRGSNQGQKNSAVRRSVPFRIDDERHHGPS
jgi:competence protein ComFC